MAGASACCNHVIAFLYKIDYANQKGYLDEACTSLPCARNKSTKQEIEPKQIKDIVIRKKIKSNIVDSSKEEICREDIRKEELLKFNPVLRHYQN